MTRQEAYDFAIAEIETFHYSVIQVNLKLPTKYPAGTFYAFFEDERTGKALCRTYLYTGKRSVSFAQILNLESLKQQNPALVDALFENGCFLYRNSVIRKKRGTKKKDNILTLFDKTLDQIPT